jgi:hypothetical protein
LAERIPETLFQKASELIPLCAVAQSLSSFMTISVSIFGGSEEFPIHLSSGENGAFEINYDSISEYNSDPYSRINGGGNQFSCGRWGKSPFVVGRFNQVLLQQTRDKRKR